MRRRRDAVLLAAGVAIVGLMCWRFGMADVAAALQRAQPRYLLLYVTCGLAALSCYVLRWRMVAATVGSRPPLRRLVAARLAGDAVGALVPSAKLAGDPLRVALLYRDGLSGPRASAGVAIDRMLESLSNSTCAVAYVAVFLVAHARDPAAHSILILLSTMLVLLVLLAVPIVVLQCGRRPLGPLYKIALPEHARWLRRTVAAVHDTEGYLLGFFREHRGVFVRGLLLSLLVEAVQILQFALLFLSFGIRLDVATLLMVLLASGMSRVVPMPAAVGVLESSEVAVLVAASARAELGFVVAMLVRLHESLWMAVGLVVLWSEGVRVGQNSAAYVPPANTAGAAAPPGR